MATYSNAPPGESDRLPDKLIAMAIPKAGAGEAIPLMQMHNPPHPPGGLAPCRPLDRGPVGVRLYVEDQVDALLLAANQGQVGRSYCVGGHGERPNK
jgi:dTDP-glucose 4,6-dehydratase